MFAGHPDRAGELSARGSSHLLPPVPASKESSSRTVDQMKIEGPARVGLRAKGCQKNYQALQGPGLAKGPSSRNPGSWVARICAWPGTRETPAHRRGWPVDPSLTFAAFPLFAACNWRRELQHRSRRVQVAATKSRQVVVLTTCPPSRGPWHHQSRTSALHLTCFLQPVFPISCPSFTFAVCCIPDPTFVEFRALARPAPKCSASVHSQAYPRLPSHTHREVRATQPTRARRLDIVRFLSADLRNSFPSD